MLAYLLAFKAKKFGPKNNFIIVTCFRVNPRTWSPMMGDLATQRVVPAHPFLSCGLDYAGPYLVKDGKLRNKRLVKCYVCIFVCFTTQRAE